MISQSVKEKTAVFIDASNIYFSQKKLKWQVDFIELKKYLEKETDLWKIFFYTAYEEGNIKQKKFLDFLEINGYILKTKKVKLVKDKKTGRFHKGNLDVELTVDAVHNKNKYKSFLLFSGDGDFGALIEYLKKHSKRCLVFSTKKTVSIELIRLAKFINIKKLENFIRK